MNTIRKKYTLLMMLIGSMISNISHADQVFCEQRNCCAPQQCCNTSSGRFFVQGDVLYWKAHISGLELNFGKTDISKFVNSCCDQVISTDECDKDPHFKWKAGYRLEAGYQSTCNNWGIGAIWTHFHDKGCRKDNHCWESSSDDSCITNTNTNISNISLSNSSLANTSLTNTGKCKIKLDQLDVILNYHTSMSDSFAVNPFAGVRATRIDEDVNAELVTQITLSPPVFGVTSTTLATETRTFDDCQTFRGIGPVFGAQLDWKIGGGFSLYGAAAASLLYGKYEIHFNDSDIFTDPLSLELYNCNDRHLHRFTWNIDLAIGIQWQTCICDSFQLIMNLGFEHHQYFDYNHLGANKGDLSFDGGIFSVGFAL